MLIALTLIEPDSFRIAAFVTLLLCTVCLIITGRTQARGVWSVPFLSLLVLIVFHAGALPEYLLRGAVFEETRYLWAASPGAATALWVSCLAVVGFTVGSLLGSAPRGRALAETVPVLMATSQKRSSLPCIALAILACSVVSWLYSTIVVAGLTPLSASYLDYLSSPTAESTAWLFQPIGVSFTLLAIWPKWRFYPVGLALFAVFSVLAFFAGYRGEVLFPLASHLGLLAYRREMPGRLYVVVGSAFILLASSVGRLIRETGFRSADLSALSPRPLDGLTELGFSQYVTEVVTDWQLADGEEPVGGLTYLAPVERLLHAITGTDRVDGASDSRLFNVVLQAREGPIGGSIIGEAIHNFGRLGPIIVLFLLGLLISWLAGRVRNSFDLSVLGVVSFAFYWHVRNASTPLTLLLAGSFAVLLASRVLDLIGARNASRARDAPFLSSGVRSIR